MLPTYMLLLLWFLATISLYFLFHSKSSNNAKKNETTLFLTPPPGPKPLPFIGNLHQFDPLKPHEFFFKLSNIYGPIIYLKLGIIPTIVISSPNLAKQVLKTLDHIFCNRPTFSGQQKLSYNGLDLAFAPYNNYWKEMRKICVTHLFCTKSVQSFSYIREEEVRRIMQIISTNSSKSMVIDLSKLLMQLANSITCRIGFGKSYVVNDDDNEISKFQGLLHETQEMLSAFYFGDYLPFMGWIDKINGASYKLKRVFKKLDEFYEEVINEHIGSFKEETKENNQDIIDILLHLRKEGKVSFELTLDHIKAVLMDIFVAGTDTSAATVVWAMTELMKNPNAMRKVQEEVRNLLENSNFIQEHQLDHLKYLKAVIKETFRLHPTSPLLVPRQTMQKCTLEGYQIESGTLVFINAYAIGRDPKIWENPNNFLPERFLDNSIDYKGQDFELIPFGAGRRICPGLLLGATTIELALANLLCFFDWELPASMNRENIDMDTLPGITIHKKNSLCLNARNFIIGIQ